MSTFGRVAQLTRYPVKSLLGEPVSSLNLHQDGPVGDRMFALRDIESGLVITGKKPGFQGLVHLSARWITGRNAAILRNRHRACRTDDPSADEILTEWLGYKVGIVPRGEVTEAPVRTVRPSLIMKPGTLTDDSPVHILTTTSLKLLSDALGRAVDPARFRANILLATKAPDEAWVGRDVKVGDAILRVDQQTERCAFPMLAQGPLPADPGLTKTLAKLFGHRFGLYARIEHPGRVRLRSPASPL